MWSTDNPYLNGIHEPLSCEYIVRDLRVEGKIPEELDGTLYRATSNQRFEPLNPGQMHWFDGDGMVHAFHLRNGSASYCNRWIVDDGMRAEVAAGHALYNGTMGTSDVMQGPLPDGVPPIKVPSNINVVNIGGRVMALAENRDHYWELVPDTLDTLAKFNFAAAFADEREYSMLTAHPHFDPQTGETLFYSTNAEERFIDCFTVSSDGVVTSRHRVALDAPSWIHDFAFTKNYWLFLLSPLNCRAREPGRLAAGKGMTFADPDLGSRLLLIDRTSGRAQWIAEPETYMVTHFLNAYQAGDTLVVDFGRSRISGLRSDLVVSDFFPFPLPGKGESPFSPPELTRMTLDLKRGQPSYSRLGDFYGEFLRLNDQVAGTPHHFGYLAATHSPRGSSKAFNCLVKYDYANDRCLYQALDADYDLVPGEPIFVPRPGATAEDDGWVLAVWNDPRRNAAEMVILDARDFDGDPVARIKLEHRITPGFHGNWIARASLRS